nr:MAG TPA: ATP synthase subunit alpha [Caudoviricetes sp.]
MKKFEELKVNDTIKVNDYTLKITGYNKEFNGYYIEGRKNNDYNTYISLLVPSKQYNKMDEISKLYATPFNKVSEVL